MQRPAVARRVARGGDGVTAHRIITKDEWRGLPALSRAPITWPTGVDLWVHHSDGPTDVNETPQAYGRVVQAIQRFHMHVRGWNDIGYAYLVSPTGLIFQGRGEALGAHCPGKNHEPSVCMLGTYTTSRPTDSMIGAIWWLMDYLRAGDLRGHREGTSTSCPGDAGMRYVVNGPRLVIEDEDPITFRARLIRAGLGPRSADVVIERLAAGYVGTIPNLSDPQTIRRLRDAGFGLTSARRIVRAMRRGG